MPKAKKKSVMYQMLVEDPKRDLPSIAKGTKTTLPDTDDDEDNSVNEPQQVGISEYIAKVREKLKRTREENKKAMIEGEVLTRTATARDQIRLEYEENQRIYLAGEAHKEAIAKLKAELRGQVTAQMKAEIYEQLREDIRRNNEGPMKAQLEAEIRVQLVEDLLGPIRAELKPKVEKILKRELETDVREQLLRELPAKLESKIEAAIKPKIEEKLRREIGARLEKEQLARADPVSPLVRPEIDGISYPDLKRLSPDDDFERYGKRRRPSYDYDGEHDADHEKRIADILEEECQQKLQRNLQLIIHQEQAGLDHIDRDISDSNDEDAGLTAKQIIQREYMRSRPIKKIGYFVESEDEYESEVSEHETDASENGGRAMKREHSEHLDEEDEYDFRKHLRTMGNANHWDPHYYTGGYFQQGRKTSRNDEHLDETEGSFDYEDDNEDHTEDLGQSDDNPVDDEETIDEEQEEIVKQPQTIDLRG
ncbi:MAG: hypothetical protein M1830_004294, partial [Pleopsidium flavum]